MQYIREVVVYSTVNLVAVELLTTGRDVVVCYGTVDGGKGQELQNVCYSRGYRGQYVHSPTRRNGLPSDTGRWITSIRVKDHPRLGRNACALGCGHRNRISARRR